jgi:putative membrane protein
MFFSVLAAIFFGVCCGIITGLTPGVHINLVSAILLSLAPIFAEHFPLILIAVLIMAMAITHSFLDSIPSVFLGAPDDATALGILPAHRYLLTGNGLMALKLFIIGGALGTILSVLMFLPILWSIGVLAKLIQPYIFWIILAIVLFMVLKDQKPLVAAMIFLLSGMLGLITLHVPVDEPLLPLLSGMFGTATLLYSINENQNIPHQREESYTQLEVKKTILGTILGAAAGFLTALLPGISASAASALTTRGTKLGDHGFLVLLGSLGSASFIFSLASFMAIEKARNGAMVVITELSAINAVTAVVLLATALCATGVAAVITLHLGRSAAKWLPRIPYRNTCIGVISFIFIIVLVRTGWMGLLILIVSTAIGLLPAALRTARSQAMGCLLLPLLFFLY